MKFPDMGEAGVARELQSGWQTTKKHSGSSSEKSLLIVCEWYFGTNVHDPSGHGSDITNLSFLAYILKHLANFANFSLERAGNCPVGDILM